MNKKTVIFGSIFTIFILVMMPNLGALEFNTVKEVFTENTNLMLSQTTTILDKFHLSDFMLNLLIILTAILQGLMMICGLELGELLSNSIDIPVIGSLFSFLIALLTGFLLAQWNFYFKEKYDITGFQELLFDFIPWLIYYVYVLFPMLNIFKERTTKLA